MYKPNTKVPRLVMTNFQSGSIDLTFFLLLMFLYIWVDKQLMSIYRRTKRKDLVGTHK